MKWFGLRDDVSKETIGIPDEPCWVNLLGYSTIATEPIPPRLTIPIKDSILVCCDLEVGASNLDKRVVGVGVLPESLPFERDFRSSLQLG